MTIEENKTYYLAGPMSGRPQYNIPMFDAVASMLRVEGYDILSPAEMDSKDIREIAMKDTLAEGKGRLVDSSGTIHTWGDFLSRDVKLVADEVDGVILLPGWEESRGARLEAFVAISSGKACYTYEPYDHSTYFLPAGQVAATILEFAHQHCYEEENED